MIKDRFDVKFSPWGIELPVEDLRQRLPGSLHKEGWTLVYHFGEEQGREYLEYFASHRRTNDTLNRIYTDGTEEVVGFCQEFFPANDPAAQAACREHNRAFYARVRALGLEK